MQRRFATLDVFTDTRFAGNPLAVVLDADGLDTPAMMKIAREFNHSETVFVQPPADASHRAKLRIFTPARELPFAGHPTVGTAVMLSLVDGRDGSAGMVLEEQVGLVPCRVRPSSADAGYAQFDLPRLPAQEACELDRGAMARALGLESGDLGIDDWSAELWSGGNPFVLVPIAILEAAGRCRVDLATFEDTFRASGRAAAFVFTRETSSKGHDFHARMFAPSFGMIEDPATGSAVAAFAGYLATHGKYADGEHLVKIEQGVEMGRPSLMELRLTMAGGRLTAASIGGGAIRVCEGRIEA